MRITRSPFPLVDLNIDLLEEKYDAKFLGIGPVRAVAGHWVNAPFGYFKANKPEDERPKGHTDFIGFGYVQRNPCVVGITNFDPIIDALYIRSQDELVYSSYRNDCCCDSTGKFSIDGGRDYTRISGNPGEWEVVKYNYLTQTIEDASL